MIWVILLTVVEEAVMEKVETVDTECCVAVGGGVLVETPDGGGTLLVGERMLMSAYHLVLHRFCNPRHSRTLPGISLLASFGPQGDQETSNYE